MHPVILQISGSECKLGGRGRLGSKCVAVVAILILLLGGVYEIEKPRAGDDGLHVKANFLLVVAGGSVFTLCYSCNQHRQMQYDIPLK